MAQYKISRITDHGSVNPEKEFFDVNGKKMVATFENGSFVTSDGDVAEYFRHRTFPNSFPDGSAPAYYVSEFE